MAKFFGPVGFTERVETAPGVWMDKTTVNNYYGDILENSSRWSQSSDSTNDELTFNKQISILADPFAYQKFHSIKYVEFMGVKWKVTSARPNYPRIILTVGGVYNG